MSDIKPEWKSALRRFTDLQGSHWKEDLLSLWEAGLYLSSHQQIRPHLQQMRNQKGPSWLNSLDSQAIAIDDSLRPSVTSVLMQSHAEVIAVIDSMRSPWGTVAVDLSRYGEVMADGLVVIGIDKLGNYFLVEHHFYEKHGLARYSTRMVE